MGLPAFGEVQRRLKLMQNALEFGNSLLAVGAGDAGRPLPLRQVPALMPSSTLILAGLPGTAGPLLHLFGDPVVGPPADLHILLLPYFMVIIHLHEGLPGNLLLPRAVALPRVETGAQLLLAVVLLELGVDLLQEGDSSMRFLSHGNK